MVCRLVRQTSSTISTIGARQRLATRPSISFLQRESDVSNVLRIVYSSADDIHRYTGWGCEHILLSHPLVPPFKDTESSRLSLEERSRPCGKSHQIFKSNIVSVVSAFKKIKNQFWNFPKVFLLGAHGNQPKLIQNNDFCRVRAFL